MLCSSVCFRTRCLLLSVVGLSFLVSGCGSNGESESGNTTESDVTTAASEQRPEVEIPSGTPDELFAFIAELDSEVLPEDVGDRAEALRIRMTKRVKACDAIMSQNVAPEAESSAVQMKLDALRTLSIVDPDGIGAEFQTYVTSLVDGSDPYLARLAQAKQFQNTVNNHVAQRSDDSAAIVDELNRLLADEDAGPRLFMEARDAIGWLVPNDEDQLETEQLKSRMKLVATCYRAMGQRFSSYEDAAVAEEAKGLLAVSDQFELELLRTAARDGKQEAIDELVGKLQAMFAASTKHGSELAFTIQTAQGLEFDGHLEPAMQLYKVAWKNVKTSEDEGLRDHVQRTFDRAGTRLSLIGRTLKIDGWMADGSKCDWQQYAGKHVVVCFWESWVQGWQEELKGMQSTLARYEGDSVVIVTVNLDTPEALKSYLAENPIDVPVVAAGSPDRSGTESPAAIRYGVDMLPFTVLVGPNGKVEKIHVFGPHLAEALESALGK